MGGRTAAIVVAQKPGNENEAIIVARTVSHRFRYISNHRTYAAALASKATYEKRMAATTAATAALTPAPYTPDELADRWAHLP